MAMTRTKIATIVTTISNVQNQATLVNDSISIALDRVYQHYDWPYYLDSKNGIINTVVDYSTGTIAITKGATTATITTGVVATNFVGRKLRVAGTKPSYRITAVSVGANTLTLDAPFQDATVITATYEIFKDEYRLQADIDKYKTLRQLQNGVPMVDITPTALDRVLPTPQNFADPIFNAMVGTNLDTYTTGTISATGTTITGVSTSWTTVEGLGRMSRIRLGSATSGAVYTVKSVDGDTQITTYETISPVVSAGSSYEIKLNNLVAQVYYLPNAARILLYRYFRQPEPLINDYDTPDMPYEFHWLLIYGALSFIYLQKGDINKAQIEAENRFIQGLEMMKQKLGSFAPDRIKTRRSIDKLRSNRFDRVENSNFDWRYSA